jgi:hypothetical protein
MCNPFYTNTYVYLRDWSLQRRQCSLWGSNWGLRNKWRSKHLALYEIRTVSGQSSKGVRLWNAQKLINSGSRIARVNYKKTLILIQDWSVHMGLHFLRPAVDRNNYVGTLSWHISGERERNHETPRMADHKFRVSSFRLRVWETGFDIMVMVSTALVYTVQILITCIQPCSYKQG